MTNPVLRAVVCIVATSCSACRGPISAARLIEQYKAAECIAFSASPKIRPHTREWDTTLSLPDGLRVIVSGAQSPGGRITVYYPNIDQRMIVADAGDYIYPSDLRIDRQNDVLYVKSAGLAGGIREETWLYKYDLRARQVVLRKQVADNDLPAECREISNPR
jgi:hypothetical protein